MDEMDRKIVGILQEDGRASNASIARRLGVSEGTIRRRLKQLIDEKAIQVTALPDPRKLGFNTEAIVGLQVDASKIENVASELAEAQEVLSVAVTTGAFDLFAWVALPSPEELQTFLLGKLGVIDGVRRSETFVTMSVRKRAFTRLS